MTSGIEKAWETIRSLEPREVTKRALVDCEGGGYVIRSLGMDFGVLPGEKAIEGRSPGAETLLKRLSYFLGHSLLWYLVSAKAVEPTGRLVKPLDLRGGEQFFRGTHVLPLEAVAGRYGQDRDGFVRRAGELQGRVLAGLGDAAVELRPLPRVPVTLILWLSDEEFPARADLLLDSTCELHLPLDVIWCAAMLTVISML